jgi:hypothetical protein
MTIQKLYATEFILICIMKLLYHSIVFIMFTSIQQLQDANNNVSVVMS